MGDGMAGMAAIPDALLPSPFFTAASALLVPATLFGVAVFLLWERAAGQTKPRERDRPIRALVLLPAAAFLLLGIGAALAAANQALLHAACVATGVTYCSPAQPSLYLGAALWIGEGAGLLLGSQLMASRKSQSTWIPRAVSIGAAIVLGGNILLGMALAFVNAQGGWPIRVDFGVLLALWLTYINSALLWFGLLSSCGSDGSDLALSARLLAWMNLVPAGLLALYVGMGFMAGGLPFGLSPPAFF